MIAVTTQLSAKAKVVKNPWYDVSTTPQLQIDQLELSDTATVMRCTYYSNPGWWFIIAKGSWLQAGGKKYVLKGTQNLRPDAREKVDSTGTRKFALVFEPIDPKVSEFDFLEGTAKGDFQIWGISTGKRKKGKITEYNDITESKEPLAMPEWRNGKGTLAGRIVGYRPEMNMEMKGFLRSAIDWSAREFYIDIAPDGSFCVDVPMYATHQSVYAYIGNWYGMLVLTEGDTCRVTLDLTENAHRMDGSRYVNVRNRTAVPDLNSLHCQGPLADVNNGITTPEARMVMWNRMPLPKKGQTISVEEFLKQRKEWTDKKMKAIDTLRIGERAKQVMRLHERAVVIQNVQYPASYIGQGTRMGSENISMHKKQGTNNMMMAYSGEFDSVINSFEFAHFSDSLFVERMKKLSEPINEKQKAGETVTTEEVEALNAKIKQYVNEYRTIHLGTDKGPLFEGIEAAEASRAMETDTPLTDEMLAKLSNPVIREYYTVKNEKLRQTLEERKKGNNFTIYETPSTDGEHFLADICKAYEGKVIMVDFWGTWCGPCRHAIKQFDSSGMKAKYKDKGVKFIYLTDDKSPEDTWRNMASGMDGDHYRMTPKQSHELFAKFGFTGWPSYLVIDKTGRYVYKCTGYRADEIHSAIDKALECRAGMRLAMQKETFHKMRGLLLSHFIEYVKTVFAYKFV